MSDTLLELLKWAIGGGVFGSIFAAFIGKKFDKAEKKQDARERARIERETLTDEGLSSTGHLAEAVAQAYTKEHGPAPEIVEACGYHNKYKLHRDEMLRHNAAEYLHGGTS